MLYDHIDLRVSDLEQARKLYDPLMTAMGFTRFDTDGRNVNYHLPSTDRTQPFFGLTEQTGHRGDASRVAFRAATRRDVDRLADVARQAGARAIEGPENYENASWYYAAFFEDGDGNKLEICYRE